MRRAPGLQGSSSHLLALRVALGEPRQVRPRRQAGERAEVEVEGGRGAPAAGSSGRTGLRMSAQLETEGWKPPSFPAPRP